MGLIPKVVSHLAISHGDGMENINSQEDLDAACSLPHALIFLWVNWAVQARQSETSLRKLMESWQRAFPQYPIPVFRADVSDQEGEIWDVIRAWLRTQARDADSLTYGGGGALLWVNAGKILIDMARLYDLETSRFLLVTCSVYEIVEPIPKA